MMLMMMVADENELVSATVTISLLGHVVSLSSHTKTHYLDDSDSTLVSV